MKWINFQWKSTLGHFFSSESISDNENILYYKKNIIIFIAHQLPQAAGNGKMESAGIHAIVWKNKTCKISFPCANSNF